MRLLILCLLFLNFGSSWAQVVNGRILDANDKPAEFATIRLFSISDSTVVKGAFADEQGRFELTDFSPGKYFLKITYANHEPYHVNDLDFIDGKGAYEAYRFDDIRLNWDRTVNVDEVTAEGSLDILKAGIDKKVYSVEDDIANKGGTVNDVLNNIPSIEVDQDGNISLRGDGNVTILIDGRPSTLAAGDGQNMLDALPANSVERIEVVTNPSAKYDPDGTSGIINIVLKKNKLKGFNGLVSATAATGNLYEGNIGLSYRNKNFNLYLNYSLNYYEGYRNYFSELEREIIPDSSTLLKQDRNGTDLKSTNTLVLGADFHFNDRNLFAFSATGSLGRRVRTGELENRLFVDNDVLDTRWDRDSYDPRKHMNYDINLNYTNTFKDRRGDISFNANQSFGDRAIEGFYEQTYYDAWENLLTLAPLNQQLSNTSENEVTTAQIDYNYVLEKIKARVEAGSKVIIRNDDVSTYSETKDTLTGYFFEDTLANFDYNYSEQIYSLYAIFGQELGKFKYQVGVRGEYAEQTPYLINTGDKYKNNYLNVFPSAHLKYNLSKSSQVSLSYSRRINRAKSRQLNPFTSYADPLNLRSGNPELQPEYIDSYDLGYSFNKKKINLSFSVFHRRTKDVINRVKRYYDNNTAIVTYDNIDRSESTGFESVIVYKPFKWMRNTLSFNGNYIDYTNSAENLDWNNDGFNWGMKYILTVDFWKKTMSAQLNAKYNAPRTTPQGIIQPRTGIDVSLEKRLFDNRFSIGARVTDIFNTKGFELELIQDGVRQKSEYKWLTRRFYITLSYKIGKYDNKIPKGSNGGDGF